MASRDGRRAAVVDVLLVVAAIGVALASTGAGHTGHSSGWSWFFDIALPLPLLVRRRYPVGALVVIGAVALSQLLVDDPPATALAVLSALYAVGAYARERWAVVLAAAGAQVGVVLAGLRFAPPGRVLEAIVLMTGTVTAAWVLGVYVRTRRQYLESLLERAKTAERDRDQQALLAAASERTRIAGELHDIVAHSISVMVALSDGAAATVTRDPSAAREASEQASNTGRQALTEMSQLLGVLRDRGHADFAPQPGVEQIEDLLTQVRTAGLPVELVEIGARPMLTPGAQLAVYRFVQEGLTNVLKHGEPDTRATVTLHYGASEVDVAVDNDGPPAGVPGAVDDERHGRGLAGMRERLAVLGGTVRAGRRTDGGWRVAGHFNLDAASPVASSDALPTGSVRVSSP